VNLKGDGWHSKYQAMKKHLSLLIWVLCFCAGFAQKKQLYGIWIEYKREVAGDTNSSRYTIDGKGLHPNLYFSVSKKDFMYSDPLKTDLFEYEMKGDTLLLTGFDKKIFTRSFRFKKQSKKELVLTEFGTGNDSADFRLVHYMRRSRQYPSGGEGTYVVYQAKDLYPQFPGGQEELKKFYKANYVKPASMDELNYEPVVKVMLTIHHSGKIMNAEILGTPLKEFAEEAIRLIRLMPDWDMGPAPDLIWKSKQPYTTFTYYPIEIVFKPKM
jgi:hypothetical protein